MSMTGRDNVAGGPSPTKSKLGRNWLAPLAVLVGLVAVTAPLPRLWRWATGVAYPLDVVELTAQLVSLESVNPGLESTGSGESAVVAYCAAWLRRAGLEVAVLEHGQGRASLVAVARGTGGGPSLLLNGHVDTVEAGSYAGEALVPVRRGGRLYGRGAYDMKSGVAAAMAAAAATAALGLRGDVVLALVGDEEHSSQGTLSTLRHPAVAAAAGAVVVEPTQLELVIQHRGFAWYDVRVQGQAAHGSRRDLGVDAIIKAGDLLHELGRLEAAWAATEPAHPLAGGPSLHASLISGGEGWSTYPSSCNVSLEVRLAPGQTRDSVADTLRQVMDDLAARDPTFSATLQPGLERAPFAGNKDSPVAQALGAAAVRTLGTAPPVVGISFWTDAALLQQAGIPSVLFGASGAGAHAAEEWVDEESVRQLADILIDTATEFCA